MPNDDEVKEKSGFSKWYAKHGKKTKEEPEEREPERDMSPKEKRRFHPPGADDQEAYNRYSKSKVSPASSSKDRYEHKSTSTSSQHMTKEEYERETKIEEKARLKKRKYEERYAKARIKVEEARGEYPEEKINRLKRQLKHTKSMTRKLSPVGQAYRKAKEYVGERAESNKQLLLDLQKQRYKYRAEMKGSDKSGRPRKNKAKQFVKAQQPSQPYRQTLSEPSDLNPRREYEFFGQPREYNLIGENKKYDLGLSSGKKHDLGIGKKYDLGVGGKKLDLFGNGNGKKKKNDKFW